MNQLFFIVTWIFQIILKSTQKNYGRQKTKIHMIMCIISLVYFYFYSSIQYRKWLCFSEQHIFYALMFLPQTFCLSVCAAGVLCADIFGRNLRFPDWWCDPECSSSETKKKPKPFNVVFSEQKLLVTFF